MTKPLIAVTCGDRILFQTDYYGGERVSYTLATVTRAIQKAGGLAVILPIHDPALSASYIEKMDGLVLTGGADVSPQFYGQNPKPKINRFDPRRDEREFELLEQALELHMPILGICRGFQLINIALGGDVYQDLSYHPNISVQHDQLTNANMPVHSIDVKAHSHFASLTPNQSTVNSYHHQVIHHLADDLQAVAWSEDGIIEAAEALNDDYNIVAVQYHPENIIDENPVHLNVFTDFIQRVNDYRS